MIEEPKFDHEKARTEAVLKLHEAINKGFCDEFEYGESCKHCVHEVNLCEPLAEVMYPGVWGGPPESELGENSET